MKMTAAAKQSSPRPVSGEFGDVGMKDSSGERCTYHLSAVLSINRRVFVPSDTLMKCGETSGER